MACTDKGEIILCENSGEFYAFVDRVDKGTANTIVSYSRGFIIGWSSGTFTIYERWDEPGSGIQNYRRIHDKDMTVSLEQPY